MKKTRKKFARMDEKQFAKRITMSLTFNKLEDLNRYIDEIEYKFESDKKNIGNRYDEELSRLSEHRNQT